MLELEGTLVIHFLNFTHGKTEFQRNVPLITRLIIAEQSSEGQLFAHLMIFTCPMGTRTETYIIYIPHILGLINTQSLFSIVRVCANRYILGGRVCMPSGLRRTQSDIKNLPQEITGCIAHVWLIKR